MIECPNCQESLTRSDYYLVRDAENVVAQCGRCSQPFDPMLVYMNTSAARNFEPIVLHVSNDNPNQVSFPGASDEAVPDGYHKVEITNMREADRWTRHLNWVEKETTEAYRASEKQYWDEVHKQRRADIRARIGSNPRMKAMFEAAQAFVDQKRERRYGRKLDPRGHFQALSFDASNRMSYCDERTGWKERKV